MREFQTDPIPDESMEPPSGIPASEPDEALDDFLGIPVGSDDDAGADDDDFADEDDPSVDHTIDEPEEAP